MQPDALPSDFQCVAVDHAGNAGQHCRSPPRRPPRSARTG
jgi:hypothetical protein